MDDGSVAHFRFAPGFKCETNTVTDGRFEYRITVDMDDNDVVHVILYPIECTDD